MINKIKIILYFLLCSITAFSQITLDRQVIGSTGGTVSITNWGSIDYTVGECIVITDSTITNSSIKYLTQGFQQPSDIRSCVTFHVTLCIDTAKNDSILVSILISADSSDAYPITVSSSNFSVFPSFSVSEDTDTTFIFPGVSIPGITIIFVASPSNNCGNEYVQINTSTIDTCDSPNNSPNNINDLTIYHAITPNSDGMNDKWIIDGIEKYPNTEVIIFNRWGEIVWQTQDYKNEIDSQVWMGRGNKRSNDNILPDGTYFYIINIPKQKPIKGWVELIN